MTNTVNKIALISDSLELYAEHHGDLIPGGLGTLFGA